MKTQEKQVLFKQKILEGKSKETANQEIKRDEIVCKESKKIIRNRLKDTKKLKNFKDKQFKAAFKELKNKNKNGYNKFLVHKEKRIINRLIESPTTQKKIAEDCCMSEKAVLEILSKLIKENKVKILELKERGTIYSL